MGIVGDGQNVRLAEGEAALDLIIDANNERQVEMANVRTTLRQRFFGPLR